MNWPAREECLAMLKEAGCEDNVIEHCLAVEALAVRIGELCGADIELVHAGALLHDIGRSQTHGVRHGIIGAEIARGLELPEEIIHIIERHLAAGLTREEAASAGLPPGEYMPMTLEEKVICHADNLIAHNKKTSVTEAIEKLKRLGYNDTADRVFSMQKELNELCGLDLDSI